MKLFYAASESNKDVLLGVLKRELGEKGDAVELGSGTGQHVTYFAKHFPGWAWQPTDITKNHIDSIEEYRVESKLSNIRPALYADASKNYKAWHNGSFVENSFDLILNVNMIHVSPVGVTEGLFSAAGVLLKPGGIIIIYGPYSEDGVLSPQSNIRFDESLRAQNSEWGVRDVCWLKELASQNGIVLKKKIEVPSNNKCLVFTKTK